MNGINAIFTTTARALAALALGCLCLLSCRKESTLGPDPDAQQQQTQVTLRITAGETPATRADESAAAVANAVAEPVEVPIAPATRADRETENEGASFENYVDITRTHILFFIDDKFSEEFIPDAVEPVGDSEYPEEWTLRGPIYNPPTAGFKVVVLANCTLPALEKGETTIEDLCKTAVYTAYTDGSTKAFQPSATRTIPMYGVRSYTGPMTFRHNVATDLGQIDLLRAMAKVIIRNTSGKSLLSATVTGLNQQGTSAPLGLYDQTSAWTHANYYDQLAGCLAVHLPEEATSNEASATDRSVSLAKAATSTAAEEVWTGYFPEYLNVTAYGYKRSDCSAISLNFSGISKTYPVDFRYYATPDATDDATRFDIKRNHIYEFDITKVDAYNLDLTLTVQPWTVQEFSYDYSENVSAESDGQQKWFYNGEDITSTANSSKEIYLSGGGNVTCTFKIDTPVGAEWIAVFEEKKGDQNHFRFIDSQGSLVDRLSGTVDGENAVTLTIRQDATTTGSAKVVIIAHYGNISFRASNVLGGEYTLVKE